MSYISVIERYHQHRESLNEVFASILTGIAEPNLFGNNDGLRDAIRRVARDYPFADLLYTLDPDGVQASENITRVTHTSMTCTGRDLSQRPYYRQAKSSNSVIVTSPYLSSANGLLCVTSATKLHGQNDELCGYLVLDIDLAKAVEFIMGDTLRGRFLPAFKVIYSLISLSLFGVVGILLYAAFREMAELFVTHTDSHRLHLKPFGVVIFLTLALAIFDLGKTILEEEVLMHKDIFRHSSTRRTITRFIAAILIAVSIEALLLMFQNAIGIGNNLQQAVWMMMSAVGLLIGLGIYVYLGAKAEALLLSMNTIK
jgi:hypothetical protein